MRDAAVLLGASPDQPDASRGRKNNDATLEKRVFR
jgi:hypothetical protein